MRAHKYISIPIQSARSKSQLSVFFKTSFIYLFLERGGGREKETKRNINVREKHWSHAPQLGLNPQPRPVPWQGTNLKPFALLHDVQSTELHQSGPSCMFLNLFLFILYNSHLAKLYLASQIPVTTFDITFVMKVALIFPCVMLAWAIKQLSWWVFLLRNIFLNCGFMETKHLLIT